MPVHHYPERLAASAAGHLTYIPRKPCKRGHLLRYTAGGCVECKALYSCANKDKILQWRRTKHYPQFSATANGRVHRLWNNARERATRFGLPFSITKADIVIPEVCPVLGLPLSFGKGVLHDGSPSLDRIIPERGYVRGNIEVISHRANTIKNSSSPEELRKIADWLEYKIRGAS